MLPCGHWSLRRGSDHLIRSVSIAGVVFHPRLRAQGMNLDTAAIEEAPGLKGQLIPEERVFKVSKPR